MKQDDFFREQDAFLRDLEEDLGIETEEIDLARDENKQVESIVIPTIPRLDFSDWQALEKEWPTIDDDLFPRWRKADIPVMIVAGFLGALLSNGLHDTFDDLHENLWGKKPFDRGGHSGEEADRIRGLFHRFKHGHDLFHPSEIDWDHYFANGDNRSILAKKVFAWLRHLFQDTFSTEGLPVPGHSFFRDTIFNELLPKVGKALDMNRYKVYKTFMTLKARDVTAAGFVPLAMTAYVFGTERGNKNKFFNYRYTSLTIGALAVSITSGLMLPNKSFNHAALAAMIPYIVTLYRVNKRINEQLAEREQVLETNDTALLLNDALLERSRNQLTENEAKINEVKANLFYIIEKTETSIASCMEECNLILAQQDKYFTELEKKYLII